MNSKIENHIVTVLDKMQDNFSFGPTCWIIRYFLNESILRIAFQDNGKIEIEIRKMNEDLLSRFNPTEPKLISKINELKIGIVAKKQEEYTANALQIMGIQTDSFLQAFDLIADFEEYLLTVLETASDKFVLEASNHLIFDQLIGDKRYRFRLTETRMRDLSVNGKMVSYDSDLKNISLRNAILKQISMLQQERSTKIRDVFNDIIKNNDKNKS